MNLSEAALAFISRNFQDGEPRGTNPFFEADYIINNKSYKFTKSVLEEMIDSGNVRVLGQNKKSVNLVGIRTDNS